MHQSPPDSQTLIKNEGTDCELVLQKILDTTADTAIIQLNKPNTVAPPLGTTILLGHIGEYEFHMGIPESAIPQIQAHALDISDEALQKNTSDFKRFSTQEKLEKWYYDPGRYVFVLMAQDTVAGIWFGRPCELPYISHGENRELIRELEAHPDLIHTSGVRIYPAFRGQWLAPLLIQKSGAYYRAIFPGSYMCVDIDSANIPSQKSYEKSGYIFVGHGENKKTVEASATDRMVYVEKPPHTQE